MGATTDPNMSASARYCTVTKPHCTITAPSLHHHRTITAPSPHHHYEMALDIAKGLDYLHSHPEGQVLHRDLKSSNCLLTAEVTTPSLHHHCTITAPSLHQHCAQGYRETGRLWPLSEFLTYVNDGVRLI